MADTQHTCRACGIQFKPKAKDRTTCCSRECGWVWVHFKRQAIAHSFRVFVRIKRGRIKPKAWLSTLPTSAECRECRNRFSPQSSGGRPSVYCSNDCRSAVERRARRVTKLRRKAVERGVDAEAIDPMRVFARDGWMCGICGRKTAASKRGTHHPKAPEMDHIVALANGGSHTWGNVQCACRECNGRKGASDYGQLMLFPAA